MALVTIQRSPTPTNSPDGDDDKQTTFLSDEISNECVCSSASQRSTKSLLLRHRSLSECYFAVKGAAVILPQNECIMMPRHSTNAGSSGGEIQLHLQAMLHILRQQDTLKMAVRLESLLGNHTRYMAIVSTMGRQDNVESVILGIDYVSPEQTTIGLVLPIWASTLLSLDGDGGISVESAGSHHVFKPVSVQAMWSVFQSLHKEHDVASSYPYFAGGLTHTWVGTYESAISSPEAFRSEWHYTFADETDLRADSLRRHCFDKPPERAAAEKLIRVKLKDIMQSVDLDEVTSKDIREKLEEGLQFSLNEYKEFIDQEMLVILGQMDKPSQIFPYLYLGTEWNASNWDELRQNSVGFIVNVTKEVDNFFPGLFYYLKIRVSDEESAELLKHWNTTFRFISRAKDNKSAVLVHCKKGISRSSSTVIAYAMKEYGWSVEEALEYVKQKRNIITPNKGFMEQLRTYQGILDASRNRNNQLWNRNIPIEEPLNESLVPWEGIGDEEDSAGIPQQSSEETNEEIRTEEDLSVIFTEKMCQPSSSSAFSNVLMASENILKPYPSWLSSEIQTGSAVVEEPDDVSVQDTSLEIDEDSLPQLSNRPPVQRTLQSMEQRIKNHPRKQPDELSLKDMQHLMMKKSKTGCDRSSSSGASCSDSSSLSSTSGDESEFTPDHSREGSKNLFKAKRRNSKSSSGESTGDSAVGELGVIGSSPKRETTIFTHRKTLSDRFETGAEEEKGEGRPRGESAPVDPESITLIQTQNRARKIIDKLKLFNRSTSTEPPTQHSPKFPLFKPATKWYTEVGKIAGSCRGRPKSEVLPGEWGGSPRSNPGKQSSIKVAQTGKVKNEREKLERLSLEQNRQVQTRVPAVCTSVRRIRSDLEAKTAKLSESDCKKKLSEENSVKSLVGVFERSTSHVNLAGETLEKEASEPREGGFALFFEDDDSSELAFRRSSSLRLSSVNESPVRPARSMISLAFFAPFQEK